MTRMMPLLSALGLLAIANCAHQQAATTSTLPAASPFAAQTQNAQAPALTAGRQATQEAQDLEALVQNTVIHFDFNADLFTPQDRQRLDKLAEVLRRRPEAGIKISGNCDERGTEEYNLALGQRRADVARKYLVTLEREVTVWQHQEAEIEVEAADEAEAERRAILVVEDDDFHNEDWEVMDCDGPHQILVPPSAGAIESISVHEGSSR